MKKSRYYVKMYILEGTASWGTMCSHIGEVKLYCYILATFNRSDGVWTNSKAKRLAVEQLHGLKEASIFNYLRLLTKSGLLKKVGKGEYKVNEEYTSYGAEDPKRK